MRASLTPLPKNAYDSEREEKMEQALIQLLHAQAEQAETLCAVQEAFLKVARGAMPAPARSTSPAKLSKEQRKGNEDDPFSQLCHRPEEEAVTRIGGERTSERKDRPTPDQRRGEAERLINGFSLCRQKREMNAVQTDYKELRLENQRLQAAVSNSLQELAELHRAREVHEAALSLETTAKEALSMALKQAQEENHLQREVFTNQAVELRQALKRVERQQARTENGLREDVRELQQKLQEAETRHQEKERSTTEELQRIKAQLASLEPQNSQLQQEKVSDLVPVSYMDPEILQYREVESQPLGRKSPAPLPSDGPQTVNDGKGRPEKCGEALPEIEGIKRSDMIAGESLKRRHKVRRLYQADERPEPLEPRAQFQRVTEDLKQQGPGLLPQRKQRRWSESERKKRRRWKKRRRGSNEKPRSSDKMPGITLDLTPVVGFLEETPALVFGGGCVATPESASQGGTLESAQSRIPQPFPLPGQLIARLPTAVRPIS